MPMSMAPAEPPAPLYGPPSTPAPLYGPPASPQASSYDPGWEPNSAGPYQRIWSGNSDAQSLAYSAYYPGTSVHTSSTVRP